MYLARGVAGEDTGIKSSSRAVSLSIVVPTYNEAENIEQLVAGIKASLQGEWAYEVIVVDDGSPDGTAEVVRRAAAADPSIRLLERPQKLGLGSAVAAGFECATGDYWLMMDADLSHRPQDLPRMFAALADADIVVGSRYVAGGGTQGWPWHRRFMSRVSGMVARLLVGVPARDATSGFAAFRREAVEPLLPSLRLAGFKLLLELLAAAPHARVIEVPITFVERQRGRSKLGFGEALTYFRLCWHLRRRSLLRR